LGLQPEMKKGRAPVLLVVCRRKRMTDGVSGGRELKETKGGEGEF
jgi:hypothetical protein